jgi:hypothetical protein
VIKPLAVIPVNGYYDMFESLKQPEYIGENRCPPCTVVNVVIALGISSIPILIAAYTATLGAPDGPLALATSGFVLAASLAAIYLRGYLVPGTPTLTKRYFPEPVLRLFDKAPEQATLEADAMDTDRADAMDMDGADAMDTDGADGSASESHDSPEEFLLDVGAVEPCDDGDDLCLTEAFRAVWTDEIEADRAEGVTAETITKRLGAPDDEYEITELHGSWVLKNQARNLGQWPSRAALIADSSAAAALSDWTDRWEHLSVRQRSELIAGLRVFLEDCPTGDGGVSFEEETVESCCREHTVLTLNCEETGERLLEVPAPEGY